MVCMAMCVSCKKDDDNELGSSKAGELGITDAYIVMNRFSGNKKISL